MDIVEGNKLIAEFMGDSYTNRNIPYWAFRLYNFDTLGFGGYEYHTSWDWLMPVVAKIESIDEFPFSELSTDINSVWQAVIQFITEYNSQPK